MSYTPKRKNAQEAFAQLVRKDRPWPGYIYPSDIDRESLRELLIAVYCPIPCDGFGNAESWHATCEAAADHALAELEKLWPLGVEQR